MSAHKSKKMENIKTEILVEKADPSKVPPVIIVHGAGSTKIGFGGEQFPRFVFPRQSTILSDRLKRFPLQGSYTTNEEWLKAYWQAMIMKLSTDLSERRVLLSLPTANLTECPFRELAQEFFYEDLQANQVAFVSDPFLSLVGYIPKTKSLTALIVDIGFSQIRIVPIYQSTILEDKIAQISFGGFDLTKTLGLWLKNKGYEGSLDALFLRDIKENFCLVRPFKQTMPDTETESFTYSIDKYNFQLTSELWKLAELFFFKDYFSKKVEMCPRSTFEGERFPLDEITLPKAIGFVVNSVDAEISSKLVQNICFTGGGTKFNGIYERILEEFKFHFPEYKSEVKIHTQSNNDLVPYIGASKLSTLPSFQNHWRNAEEYDEGLFDLFL